MMNTSDNTPPLNLLVRPPLASDTLIAISNTLHFVSDSCLNYTSAPDIPTDQKGFAGLHTVLEHVIEALEYEINRLDEEKEGEADYED